MRTMGRKRSKAMREPSTRERDTQPTELPPPSPTPEPEPEPMKTTTAFPLNRIGIAIKEDGTFDTDSMRTATRQKFRDALAADSTLYERLGLRASTSADKLTLEFNTHV